MISAAIFIFGLCIGSFLNVVIDRLPQGKSIIAGRSFCDHCKHVLGWGDLIPVVSFLFLRDKCRWCGRKISWQYPIVELITGLLFLLTYNSMIRIIEPFKFWLTFVYYIAIVSGLIVIFFTDLKYHIIPDQILIFLTVVTIFFLIFWENSSFPDHLLAALGLSSFFLFLVLVTKGKGMGLGDVKYAFVMGFILGIYASIISFYLSFLTGAAVSLILVIVGKKTLKSAIPFGPFLVGGTLISVFYGAILWELLRRMIGI